MATPQRLISRAAVRAALSVALLGGVAPSGCAKSPPAMPAAARPATLNGAIAAAADPRGLWPTKRYVRFDMVVRDGRGKQYSRETILLDRREGYARYEVDMADFSRLPFAEPTSGSWQAEAAIPVPDSAPPAPGAGTGAAVNSSGGRLVALVNVRTKRGEVYLDRRALPMPPVGRVLQRIDQTSLWLLLPLLADAPGARAEPLGAVKLMDGSPANEVRLRLGEPTSPPAYPGPGSDWRLMLAPDAGRILRTQIVTPGSPQAGRVLGAEWRGQVVVDGISLCPERALDDGRQVLFDHIAFPAILSPRYLSDPTAPTPQ
ncbi:MAG: hypothetical protein NTW19_25275 [Planctomycetota bacterium]|nr:hypothetical protein [Planctomycetota bacterium]